MGFASAVLLAAAIGLGASPDASLGSSGRDFRIDNAVYIGDQKGPIERSTTIFLGGAAYDIMATMPETVVFEPWAGRFVLLNMKHQAQTELTTTDIAALTGRLGQLAAKSTDPLIKFLAEPKFHEHFAESLSELTLSSPVTIYRVRLVPEADPDVVQQYRGFLDWSARLNSLLVPGSQPPFGRLALNAAIAKQKATASQVIKSYPSGKGANRQRTTIRSVHRITRPLAQADLERVAQVRQSMDRFKLVPFDQYRRLDVR